MEVNDCLLVFLRKKKIKAVAKLKWVVVTRRPLLRQRVTGYDRLRSYLIGYLWNITLFSHLGYSMGI